MGPAAFLEVLPMHLIPDKEVYDLSYPSIPTPRINLCSSILPDQLETAERTSFHSLPQTLYLVPPTFVISSPISYH